ncbi:extradiol ring-cleavage dioxygenase [Kyrpidia spormannii]|uniref:Extradiol ring-cleavage dioxygenase n=1 Tax=Kyrpidia spormannii TaxID=2055160 RepID=A0A2K8NA08_9BACL|nr:MEMO1 family protein [Kyrpidia spormannii]ATY85450.1 extradiol ring-cleavage dioxygenase [Kyrpidia spormannii]
MSMDLAILSTHTPRMCHRDRVPPFQEPLVHALDQASGQLSDAEIDVLVTISCHWMSTFDHYVDATPVHEGLLTAEECPDLISQVPYRYRGDRDLGIALAEAGRAAGIPVISFEDPAYVLDYGTVVPLRYLDPREELAVVPLSVCWSADLDESYQWGQVIGQTLKKSGRRAAFVASGALSHNLVRGPERWPTTMEMALDQKFIELLQDQKLEEVRQMLPSFAQAAKVESGGRHVAVLLGVLSEIAAYHAEYLGYAQSSGSGNPIMVFSRR